MAGAGKGGDRLDAVSETAIGWWVELRSGQADARAYATFTEWHAADPRHAAAWQRLEQALGQAFDGVMDRLPATGGPEPARQLDQVLARLQGRVGRRRLLGGALGVAGIGLGTVWLARWLEWLPDFGAGMHTGIAERRRWAMPGGGSVLLDACSAADMEVAGRLRVLRLREGQLIAEMAETNGLPLSASGRYGAVHADETGSRLLLRQETGRTLVVALRHALQVSTKGMNGPAMRLEAGEGAWLAADGVTPADATRTALAANWQQGVLSVFDVPLSELVQSLRAYRHGVIRVSAAAGTLRVSGRYPLDDTGAALRSLAETLPIVLEIHSGGWWVSIDRRGD